MTFKRFHPPILFVVATFFVIFPSMWASGTETTTTGKKYKACNEDLLRQHSRSKELQILVAADQADRQAPNIDWEQVAPRDERRAKRVGEIFGEGCFVKGADFSAAALIFQHGPSVDHNFQAYIWAKKALELGDTSRPELIAEGIDRFLVRQGF